MRECVDLWGALGDEEKLADAWAASAAVDFYAVCCVRVRVRVRACACACACACVRACVRFRLTACLPAVPSETIRFIGR